MNYDYLIYFYLFFFGIVVLLVIGELIVEKNDKSSFAKWWRKNIIANGDEQNWN